MAKGETSFKERLRAITHLSPRAGRLLHKPRRSDHEHAQSDWQASVRSLQEDNHMFEDEGDFEAGAPFKHKPLDMSGDQIRLARFHASEEGEQISFEVISANVGQLKHEALSYVWGPPTATRAITHFVTERVLLVRENLFEYLRIWYKGVTSPWIWIDQVCIDQTSVNERNHQVQLMEKIFSTASQVVVWLGNDARLASSDDALAQRHCHAAIDHDDIDERTSRETFAVKDIMELTYGLKADFTALFSMNIYWTRLWVLQEIILARKLSFRLKNRRVDSFGKTPFPFDGLPPVFRWIMQNRGNQHQRETSLRPINSIYDCFENTADNKCEDPRDKLFGLQSLLAERDRISIDYNKATRLVFLEGAVTLMLRTFDATYENISRCMYFFGRGMGVIDNSFAWVDLAWRLDRANLPVDQKSHGHINVEDPKFEELIEKLWLAIDDMLVD